MGYTIEYLPNDDRYSIIRKDKKRTKQIVIFLACILLLVMGVLWRDSFLEWFLPGDTEVTATAIENVIDMLGDGVPFDVAIDAFCREIIKSGV